MPLRSELKGTQDFTTVTEPSSLKKMLLLVPMSMYKLTLQIGP